MRHAARLVARAAGGEAATAHPWQLLASPHFATKAGGVNRRDWATVALERAALALQERHGAGEPGDELSEPGPAFALDADPPPLLPAPLGRPKSRRRGAPRGESAPDQTAFTHALPPVKSVLTWPPPAAAVAHHPELQAAVKQSAREAPSPSAAATDDPELARVKAFALRVAQRLSRRVPLTAKPALTRTVLNTFYKLPELVDECRTLAIQLDGSETKPKVIDLLLDKAQKTPNAFGQVPNKRFTGLPLPWDETERLPYHANGKRSLTPRQGATPEQRLSPALPDPARSERRQYARIVDAHSVADMLLAAHAEDVAILHVGTVCTWTDAMVIATARSEPHLSALAGAAMHFFSQARAKAVADGDPGAKTAVASVEGQRSSVQRPDWLVVDMDSVVVHMFTRDMRAEYALEELWGKQHGCRVDYLTQNSSQAAGEADQDGGDGSGRAGQADGRDESDGGATSGDGRWVPVVYDRRARTFRPFGGAAPGPTQGEVQPLASGSAAAADGTSEADSESETDRDEELNEEQVVALQRYEMAHAVINAREELRQQRQDERASAQRTVLAAKAKAKRSMVENRRRKAEIRQALKKSTGVEASELRVKAPSIGMRIRALRDALAQGVKYGTAPGDVDTKHTPGCTCRACLLVAAEADKLANSERGQATLTMAPVAQWTPCEAECSCETCRWTRQRIQNMVLAGGSETARVAGLMHLRLIQNKQRRLARPKAVTTKLTKKAAKARAAAAKDAETPLQQAAQAD